MICLAVTYVMRPGTEAEAVDRLRLPTEATRLEPGCRFYQAHRSTADPRTFFLDELYEDEAALEFHRATPHFAEHVIGGIRAIAETRSPESYEPSTD